MRWRSMHGCPVRRIQRRAATRVRITYLAVKATVAPACGAFQCHVITRHELATAVYNMATDAGSMVSLALTVVPCHLSLHAVATTRGHRSRRLETATSTDVYTSASTRHCMLSVWRGVERTGCESVPGTAISRFLSFSSLDERGVERKQRLRESRLFDRMRWWWWSWSWSWGERWRRIVAPLFLLSP